MSCPDLEAFEDYLSGNLAEAAAQSVEQHVGGCSACSVLFAEVKEDREILGQLDRLPPPPQVEPPALPESVGPYRVERVLGVGGMGVVYLAEQENPRRHVALKVIRGDHNDPRQVRRFQREVETLARLQHPGIAAIFDAGCTESGQHYFAMERIDGVPLDQSLLREDWGLKDKLDVFCQVCDAVEYAHQNGVIHRDLKPANVMVDKQGRPKVLDFGLAHLTDPDTDLTTIDSRMARIQGTLPYMSPEQARGGADEVAASSDVYALGVVLYEMLTGRRPHELQRVPPPQAVRVICEDTPRPPSAYATSLPHDLDTIVLKAIEKEPSRRYASARELAEDVRRHRDGQAILARRPSATYRLKKLIVKNRLPTVLVAVVVVLSLSSAIWQGVLRERSEQASLRAQRRSEFIQDVMASLNPKSGGRALSVPEALASSLADIGTQFAEDPAGEAEVRMAVAETLDGRGYLPEARDQMERALLIYRDLGSEQDEEHSRCMLFVGRLRRDTGDLQSAESLLVELLEWEIDREPESMRVADTLGGLADLYLAQGRLDEALSRAEEEFALRSRLDGEDALPAATSVSRLGSIQLALGNVEKAVELHQQVVDAHKAGYGLSHTQTAVALNNLGASLSEAAEYDKAEAAFRECLELRRELLGPDHVETVQALGNLGGVLVRRGEFEEAETLLSEACSWLKERPASWYPWSVTFLNNYAFLAGERGDLKLAEARFREVIAQRRESQSHLPLANSLSNLGRVFVNAGRLKEASRAFEEAFRIFQKFGATDQPAAMNCRANLAAILALRGRSAEAEELFRGLLASAEKLGADHPNASALRLNLSRTLRDQWRGEEAKTASTRALTDLRKRAGETHPIVVSALNNLAAALLQLEEYAAALQHLEEALRIGLERFKDIDHALLQKTRHNQATAWFHSGEVDRAERETAALLALRREQTRALDLADSLELQARIDVHRGDHDVAESAFEEAAELRRSELVAGHWSVALLDSLRGECLMILKRYEEADPCLAESAVQLAESLGPEHRLSREARARLERLDSVR